VRLASLVSLDLLDPEVPLDILEGLEVQDTLDTLVALEFVASKENEDFLAVLLVCTRFFCTSRL